MINYNLNYLFDNKYIERIKFLISESFTEDLGNLIMFHPNEVNIDNYMISDHTYSMHRENHTNFGIIQFFETPNNFLYYRDFDKTKELKIRLLSRVFNEKSNYVEIDTGIYNLNEQFDNIKHIAKRDLNFYKLEQDKKASDVVQELAHYFNSNTMALYKVLTENENGYEHSYIVRGSSFFCKHNKKTTLFKFNNPYDILNDELFQSSIKELIHHKIGNDVEVDNINIYEYLELIKMIGY